MSEIVGLDVGGKTSVVTRVSGEIVRNELGGHSSASLCSYLDQERFIGEAAFSQLTTNANNTILIGECLHKEDALITHRRFEQSENGNMIVNYGDNDKFEISPAGVLASLVKKLARLAESSKVAYAIPPCWDDSQIKVAATAIRAARLDLIALPKSDECLRAVYALKHAPSIPPGERRVVAMIDIGRCITTCSIVAFSNGSEDSEPQAETLGSVSAQQGVSVAALDAALFDWLLKHRIKPNVAQSIKPATKKGARLLLAVETLRKLLSTMKEASVLCENLDDDNDLSIPLTRDELATATKSVLDALRSTLESCRAKCETKIDAVEVLGGGGRVAIFRTVISEVFAVSDDALGAKLDDASVAHGAALIAASSMNQETQEELVSDETQTAEAPKASSESSAYAVDETEVETLAAAEDTMTERDTHMAVVASERNRLETLILELRRPEELSQNAELMTALNTNEDWLWEQQGTTDAKVFTEKRSELEAYAKELCPEYFANLEAERAKTEAEIEASAADADNNNGDDDDDERREDRINADTRKLKFSDRMRLVTKNKEEATELFKDGNHLHAAKRYKDALGHASKLNSESLEPDESKQLLKAKIDLNVNLSLCWTKLNNLDQSLRACEAALTLDDAHPKALFRRAFVYEQTKRFEEARTDLKRALEIVPEDKALNQLLKRVEMQIARQKKQEKKMWGKAFAS